MLVVPTGGSFRLANPNMWTRIIDPVGLKKVLKIPEISFLELLDAVLYYLIH
jgi:hypothetical protein